MKTDFGIDVVAGGEIRRTLMLNLARDAAESSSRPALETVLHYLEHPLLKGGLDCEFLRAFLDETRANRDGMRGSVVLAYAELGYQLARQNCRELAPQFLGIVVKWATDAPAILRVVPYVREGLKEYADAKPELRGAWERCLGHEAYARRAFREASVHFEQALVHNQAAGDVRTELDNLTSLGACHMFLRNDLEAIRCAERAERIARDIGDLDGLTKALGDQGNSEFRLQRFNRARKHFEAALEAAERGGNKQRQSDWSGMLGNVWAVLGELEKAEAHQRHALALSLEMANPESEQADRHNLAAVLWIRERYDESIEHDTIALRIAVQRGEGEQAAAYRRTLQEHYVELGLNEKAFALQQLEKKEEPKPEDEQPPTPAAEPSKAPVPAEPSQPGPEVLWEREFLAAIRDHEFDRAEKMVEDYISGHPDSATGYFHRGLLLNEAQRYDESIAAYDEALARNPQLVSAHYNRLNSYVGKGDLETPRRLYEQQRSDSPLDPIPRMLLGRIAVIDGDLNAGVRELREAHRLAPEDYSIHTALCEGLLQLAISTLAHDFDEAWSVYELCADEFVRLIDDHPTMRASSYIGAGECNEKMAMESHFQQPPLTLEFGDTELQVLGYALNYFRKAAELAPHMQRPRAGASRVMEILIQFAKAPELTRVARVLRETGLPREALMLLTLSLDKDKRLAATQYELGLLYLDESANDPAKKAEARKSIESALQLDPGNQEYRATLRRLDRPPR